eukprot:TRINITY_DN5829_c0_g1_i1.p1 TRINITY_DN5829_c0_g1~~TRINITY_DN5829_c0_g1_i1.p1  ORF type:complete len:170 (-),score=33.71 TRINITY_DN5829_c0_g1_i1:25-534(-)
MGVTGWPNKVITEDPTPSSVLEALENGPYGRCVYNCDNDVVDNQVVNFQFVDGSTASFTMVAFSENICVRKTTIFGTKGELVGDGNRNITVFDFLTQTSKRYSPDSFPQTSMQNHGGGDYYLMADFICAVASNDQSFLKSTPEETLESHLAVFRAEESRITNQVINTSW